MIWDSTNLSSSASRINDDDRRFVKLSIVMEAKLTHIKFVPKIEIGVTSIELISVLDDAEIVKFSPSNEEG